MKRIDFRLDDVARNVVHFFPEAVFELFSPVEPLSEAKWSEWIPTGPDHLECASNPARRRSNVRRLDTQLAPVRYLPDVGYACTVAQTEQLWGLEVQSKARKAPLARASTCMAHLLRQAYPDLLKALVEVRGIELRLVRAARYVRDRATEGQSSSSTVLPHVHVDRPARHHEGLVRFETSDALLTLQPNDRRFSHPWYWPLVCLCPRVSAEQIVDRHNRLLELERLYRTPFAEVRLLLGMIGRVRFPDDNRFPAMTEIIVNDVTSHAALNLGHMTERERRQFLMDLTDRQTLLFEQRLKDARESGKLEAQREGMLRAARRLLSAILPTSEVDETMLRLSQLPTVEAIDAALAELTDAGLGQTP